MSALLAHAKAARVLGNAIRRRAFTMPGGVPRQTLSELATAHIEAADEIEALARSECSGEDRR